MVFDDVHDGKIMDCELMAEEDTPQIVLVENRYKRPTNLEYVPDYPYHTTDNSVTIVPGAGRENYYVERVCVDAPAPGTPRDSLYEYPTVPVMSDTEPGYTYETATEDYELPATVYRPYFVPIDDIHTSIGKLVCFDVLVRNPLTDGTEAESDSFIWNEGRSDREYVVGCESGTILMQAEGLPAGADFDILTGNFIWTPEQAGEYDIRFTADDGVIPISMGVHISVEEE